MRSSGFVKGMSAATGAVAPRQRIRIVEAVEAGYVIGIIDGGEIQE